MKGVLRPRCHVEAPFRRDMAPWLQPNGITEWERTSGKLLVRGSI